MAPRRRFSATAQTTNRDLQRIMIAIGATSLRVNQEVMKGDVEVVFDRAGLRYVFRCAKWQDSIDNLRAISHVINFMHRALTEYGVTTTDEKSFDVAFRQVFGGFLATPDDSVLMLPGGGQWWVVLGVERGATKSAIRSAYRALALTHHPDHGGNDADFQKLRAAYDQGMREAKS